MKVLHLSFTNGNGGAGLGANRLHLAMLAEGVHSQMLVANKVGADPQVLTLGQVGLGPAFKRVFAQQRGMKKNYNTKDKLAIRSINLPVYDIAKVVNEWDADIVQMHWVGNGFMPVSELAKINKPVFWKLPDMWAFSGAEHYREEVESQRHIAGYTRDNRPACIATSGEDMDARVWQEKMLHWTDLPLTVVTPSRWLGREAHFSQLFQRYDVHVIPNPLDTSMFKPLPKWRKHNLRSDFDLSTDKHLIAFVSMGAEGKRKGYHYLEAALHQHMPQHFGPDSVEFFVLGSDNPGIETIAGYRIIKLGRINDQDRYAELLAMGDSCTFPTEIDNLPNVVTEAMACGLPVVSFDVGGVPDQIAHLDTGYLANAYDPEDLSAGMAWAVGHGDLSRIAGNARKQAVAFTCQRTAVQRYLALYRTTLNRTRSGVDALRPSARPHTPAPPDPEARTQGKPMFPVQSSQSPLLNDPLAIAAARPSGAFNDYVFAAQNEPPRRFIIMEPAALDVEDSSHNAGYLKVLTEALVKHSDDGVQVCWVTNRDGRLENPHGPVLPLFPYSQYDAVRSGNDAVMQDKASRCRVEFTAWPGDAFSSERSVYDVFAAMQQQLAPLTGRDSVFIPMADRLMIEAALLWKIVNAGPDAPSLHIMIMFERANWLTGGYPFDDLMCRLRNSNLTGRGIYLYTESDVFSRLLKDVFNVQCDVMIYPVERSDGIEEILTRNRAGHEKLASQEHKQSLKVSILGRGRRDKGFALLPDIIEEYNRLEQSGPAVEFVIQDGRQMDNLAEASARLRTFDNVTLLDEFISNDDFERHQTEADIVLLPYDRSVYKRRGSSIVWRAVSQAKPLVLTRKSALAEGLLTGNGIAAEPTAKAFAGALREVVQHYPQWRARALTAAATYWGRESEYAELLSRNSMGEPHLFLVAISDPSDMDVLRKLRRRCIQSIAWWIIPKGGSATGILAHKAERDALLENQAVMDFASEFDPEYPVLPEPLCELLKAGRIDRILVASDGIDPAISRVAELSPEDIRPQCQAARAFIASSDFRRMSKIGSGFEVAKVRVHTSFGIKRNYRRSLRWLKKRLNGDRKSA